MIRLLFRLSLVVLLIFAPGQAGAVSGPEPASPYTLSVIPFYSPEKIWAQYQPFVDFLRGSTGKPWQLKLYPSHDALISALCGGEVSLALLGPVPLGRVMDSCGAEPVAVALGPEGRPVYRAILVTAEPEINSLADLRGRRFGLFKGSTAAHILPRKLLKQAGLGRQDIEPVFYEGQDHLVNALLSRKIAAAGLKESLYKKFSGQGLRALATSEALPNFAFAAAPGLSPEIREPFVRALLGLEPGRYAETRKLTATWGDEIRYGFILPDDAFRAAVRYVIPITNEIMNEDR